MRRLIFMITMLLLCSFVYGYHDDFTLLAVSEQEDGSLVGGTAKLIVDINDGQDRVFLDTYPITKINTQISTRFAKQIACNYYDLRCENKDFFYTIRSNSPIIGGPSAGGAISVFTSAIMMGLEIDHDVAMTGTINSGGIIGPVGGLKEKIGAAKEAGMKKVLIPLGSRMYDNSTFMANETNTTKIDLIEFGKSIGIEVVEVATLDEALAEFSPMFEPEKDGDIKLDDSYKQTMGKIAVQLCDRNKKLMEKVDIDNLGDLNASYDSAYNLTMNAEAALENEDYYSAASYCFGSNVNYNFISLADINLSLDDVEEKIGDIEELSEKLRQEIETKQIITITDLETYMVVNDRLEESEIYFENIKETNDTNEKLHNLAFGIERFYSAYSWAMFFDNRGKRFDIDKEHIRELCEARLAEANERQQYLNLFLPINTKGTEKKIDDATKDLNNGEFSKCLFKASTAKAEIDVVLSSLGVMEEDIDQLIDVKLETAKREISRQNQKGIFPLLGYSYYEYANDLRLNDKYSALLFAEYSLELSNLDIYLEEEESRFSIDVDYRILAWFGAGVVIGILIGIMIKKRKNPARLGILLGKKR